MGEGGLKNELVEFKKLNGQSVFPFFDQVSSRDTTQVLSEFQVKFALVHQLQTGLFPKYRGTSVWRSRH